MRNGPIIQLPFRTTLPGDARQTKYDVMLTHPETNVVDDLNDSGVLTQQHRLLIQYYQIIS